MKEPEREDRKNTLEVLNELQDLHNRALRLTASRLAGRLPPKNMLEEYRKFLDKEKG